VDDYTSLNGHAIGLLLALLVFFGMLRQMLSKDEKVQGPSATILSLWQKE
jgi:hypothetical protein